MDPGCHEPSLLGQNHFKPSLWVLWYPHIPTGSRTMLCHVVQNTVCATFQYSISLVLSNTGRTFLKKKKKKCQSYRAYIPQFAYVYNMSWKCGLLTRLGLLFWLLFQPEAAAQLGMTAKLPFMSCSNLLTVPIPREVGGTWYYLITRRHSFLTTFQGRKSTSLSAQKNLESSNVMKV